MEVHRKLPKFCANFNLTYINLYWIPCTLTAAKRLIHFKQRVTAFTVHVWWLFSPLKALWSRLWIVCKKIIFTGSAPDICVWSDTCMSLTLSFSHTHTYSWQPSSLAVMYFSSMPCSMSGAISVVWQCLIFSERPFSHENMHTSIYLLLCLFLAGSSFVLNTPRAYAKYICYI